MGWDFYAASKDALVADLLTPSAGREILASKVKGKVLWTVERRSPPLAETAGEVSIGCYLLSCRGRWGYKAMCEMMGPFYYDCPLEFLDLAPVACQEWRDKVREHHAMKISKPVAVAV